MNIYSITTDIGDLNEHLKKIKSIDLTSYATRQYVDDAVAGIDITSYATKNDLTNNYYNKNQTDEQIDQKIEAAIGEGTIDLSEYVSKAELNGMSYVSTDDLNEMGYITSDSLRDYAKKSDLASYATTSSLGEYAKKSDLTPYATTESLGEYAKKTDLTPYATKQEVNDAIDGIDIPHVDLTNYYTKDEVFNKAEVTQRITDAISGGTVDLSEYVSKEELYGMSYVTTSDLNDTGYVTTSALNDMNFAKTSDLDGKQDKLSNANVLNGITSTKVSNWDGASSNSHTHSNKSVLDNITSDDITNWNSKTSNAGTITGIKMNGASKGTSGVVDLGTVLTSETDPVFAASAAHGITASDITNWNSKTDNVGTVTGIKINANTFNPDNTGIVDITNSYNSLWTSYQALMNQVTYLYAHVVWKSDEGGDEPTPEPTEPIYIGSSMAATNAEVDVTGFTDITTAAKNTMDDTSSAGAGFTTPTSGYVWIVVPESYGVVNIWAKTGSLPGYETQLYRDEGTLNGLHYWANGPEDEETISAGQECTIVLLTH